MNALLRTEGSVSGFPLMKFTLTYDGELKSNAVRQKWEIRKHLSPQLAELWSEDPTLRDILRLRYVPLNDSYSVVDRHHSSDDKKRGEPQKPPVAHIDTCEVIERGGRQFLPLVRDNLVVRCGLKILFLRKEEPGRVYQGGDLDNRLKTLFDALSVPNQDQIVEDPMTADPIYCLLEDDSLIAGCSIETHRLLSRPNASKHEVRLIIEVDVRVSKPRPYNQPFLGD